MLVGAAIVAGLAALSLYSVLRIATGDRVGKTVVVHGRYFAGNVPTPERFHTAPCAVCHVESDRTANAYRFVADPDGMVQMQRFQRVHPPLIRDSFICDESGAVTRYVVLLRRSYSPAGIIPVRRPLPVVDAAYMAAFVRKHGFDPRTASDDVLRAHGLPPRPTNLATDPRAAELWNEVAFTPTIAMHGPGCPMPWIRAGSSH